MTGPATGPADASARGVYDPAAAVCEKRDRPYVLAATILASAMAFIEGSVVTLALPAIERDLSVGFAALQWVNAAYLLSLSALVVVGGALGDRIGRRRVFALGVWIFGLASIACAFAGGGETLVAARAIQGVGAALLIPQSLAILAASYPRAERGGAIGLWASASALTTAAGPPIGGVLVDAFGWPSVFWINAPLAAVVLGLIYARMPESRADAPAGPPDWLGAGAVVLGLGLGAWALIEAPSRGGEPLIWAAAGAGLAALVAFVVIERRARAPIAPPELFARPAFSAAMLTTLFVYAALGGALFLLPLDLTARSGHTAAEAGYALAPFAVVIGLLSGPAGRLTERLGARLLVAGGALGVSAACAALAAAPPGDGYPTAAAAIALAMGVAMAGCAAPISTATMNAAPDALSGAASGLSNAVSRAAGLLAVTAIGALSAAIYAGLAPRGGAAGEAAGLAEAIAAGAQGQAIDAAFAAGYLACAAAAFFGAVAALGLPGAGGAGRSAGAEPGGERVP